MKEIRLKLADCIHNVLERIIAPLSDNRKVEDKEKKVNIFLPEKLDEIITLLAQKHKRSKAVIIQIIMGAFYKAYTQTNWKKQEKLVNQIAVNHVKEKIKLGVAKYRLGVTKVSLITAILIRISEQDNLLEKDYIFNQANQK